MSHPRRRVPVGRRAPSPLGGRVFDLAGRRASTLVGLGASALLVVALAACSDHALAPAGPVDPGTVTIRLSVTGGFAGVQYSFVVDGSEGRVVGETCGAHCPFGPGETVLPLSRDQVVALAARLEEAGVRELDGRDFGVQCCDDFAFVLTYVRAGRTYRVTGGGSTLPDDLGRAVGLLHGVGFGMLPTLVSPDARDVDWPRDPYTLGEVRVEGSRLTARMTYGGGCGEHRIDLVAWGGWMESEPLRINALLTHDDSDDPCDAVLTTERSFDLLPLRESLEAAYGSIGEERPTVLLLLWDPRAAGPLGRVIEVVL